MCHIVENLLVGIVGGLASSVIVTQIYRNVDKKRDRFEYINELTEYAYEFYNHLFYAGTVEISDEYIIRLADFIVKNTLPRKKKWVRLTRVENMICNDFANFCKESCIKILSCKLDIQRIEKGEDEYINEVEQSKIAISNTMHLESQYYWEKLMEIRKKYID